MLNKHEKQELMESVYKVEVESKTVFNLVENEKKMRKKQNTKQLQLMKEKEQHEMINFGQRQKPIMKESQQKVTELPAILTQKSA